MVESYGDHGFDVRPGAWKPPAIVTPDIIAEAKEHLVWTENVLLADAGTDTIRTWLLTLGNATASSSKLTADDVDVKIAVLLGLLDDYPAGTFTKASLKRAARRFRFFPGFEELAPFLDDEAVELRRKRDRLLAITRATSAAPAATPEDPAPPATEDQIVAVREMLATAGVPLKEAAAAPTASAAPGEIKRVPGSADDGRDEVDRREAIRRVMAETEQIRRAKSLKVGG